MFGRKKEDKAQIDAKNKEADVAIIDNYFPTPRGIKTFLKSNDLFEKAYAAAQKGTAQDAHLFLKLMDRSVDDKDEQRKFAQMSEELRIRGGEIIAR
jgi:hypothetical protein